MITKWHFSGKKHRSLQLHEILTQFNNVMLLQNTLLRYFRQEYRLQDMANNPSTVLSTGNASAGVCSLALGKRLDEGHVPAGKYPVENRDDDQQR